MKKIDFGYRIHAKNFADFDNSFCVSRKNG